MEDLINAGFEIVAGFMVLLHCRTLLKDKMVKGVNVLATAFFTGWGVWNLHYYPHLEQMWSFYASLLLVAANTLWLTMMLHYKRKEQHGTKHIRSGTRY